MPSHENEKIKHSKSYLLSYLIRYSSFLSYLIFSDLNMNDLVHCLYFSALKGMMILFVFIISTNVLKAFHSCSFGACFVLTFFEEFAFEKSWILIFCTKGSYLFFDAIFHISTCTGTITDCRGHLVFLNKFTVFSALVFHPSFHATFRIILFTAMINEP